MTAATRKRVHKRPSYKEAVFWIVHNDEAGSSDATKREVVALYVSTLLVADLFGCDPELVAADIVAERLRQDCGTCGGGGCPECGCEDVNE